MNKILAKIDWFQRHHKFFGFPYAVIKKYGDDQAGYLGALLTYYGFLSLFPLLIVVTSIVDLIAQHNLNVRAQLFDIINRYFPIVGSQLEANIHSSSKTGIALVLGLLILFYGSKGVADALQNALNQVWQVPRNRRRGFPKNILTSFTIIIVGGLGLLTAAVLSGVAASLGHSMLVSLLSILVSIVVLFCLFLFIMSIGSSSHHSFRANLPGAVTAAIGLQLLQILGGYLITHQLHNLNGLYGQFALVLAILFWIYLQAQVFLYAVEVNSVVSLHLWPRAIVAENPTEADRKAGRLYARKESLYEPSAQEIDVEYQRKERN